MEDLGNLPQKPEDLGVQDDYSGTIPQGYHLEEPDSVRSKSFLVLMNLQKPAALKGIDLHLRAGAPEGLADPASDSETGWEAWRKYPTQDSFNPKVLKTNCKEKAGVTISLFPTPCRYSAQNPRWITGQEG